MKEYIIFSTFSRQYKAGALQILIDKTNFSNTSISNDITSGGSLILPLTEEFIEENYAKERSSLLE